MDSDEIDRVLKFQVVGAGSRVSGARGARRLFAFLRDEALAHGYVTEETTFPLRAMRIDTLEHHIGSEPFYALPYFGCPPFYPYPQYVDWEVPLDPAPVGENAPRDHIALADIEDGAVEKQIRTYKAAGYRGVIFISRRESDADLLGLFSSITTPALAGITASGDFSVTCVSRRTGKMLAERASRGLCVKQYIDVSVAQATAHNLFIRPTQNRQGEGGSGEGGGRRKMPRVRVVCHYDCAFEAPDLPGASDNASGVAVLVAVLKALARQGACPPDVEVVFYDAEEYLLFGALSLLVDLDGELGRRSWDGLYDVLAAREGGVMEITAQPEHIIEIDTVGCGRTLRYGANKPGEVAELLKAHNLGGAFDKIRLSREKGNVEFAAAQAGIATTTTHHFLTLGAGRRAHTRRDDMAHINRDDMAAVAGFLQALITLI